MNKFKKVLVLFMVYVMTITLIPSELICITANAEETVRELYEYNEIDIGSFAQYKDELLLNYFYEGYMITSLYSNSEEKEIDKQYWQVTSPVLSNQEYPLSKISFARYKEFDFSNRQLSSTEHFMQFSKHFETDRDRIADEIKKCFDIENVNVQKHFRDGEIIKKNGIEYHRYAISYTEGSDQPITNGAIVSNDMVTITDRWRYGYVAIIGDNKFLIKKDSDNDEDQKLLVYDQGKLVKEIAINLESNELDYIVGENYVTFNKDKSQLKIYKVNSKNELELTDNIIGVNEVISNDIDSNSFGWILCKKGEQNYLCKIENGKLIYKCKVDPDMSTIDVYDDKNFTVANIHSSMYSVGKITFVSNGKYVDLNKFNENGIVSVTGISLNKTSLSIDKNTSTTLIATVSPSNATNKGVIWRTTDKSIAKVDQNGKVTGVSAGTATITVTTNDGNMVGRCKVTVKNPIVSVTGISLNKTSVSIAKNTSTTLIATVSPSNATDKGVIWRTTDKSIVTVDQKGKITAVKAGTATITVTTNDGNIVARCKVTVK